MQCDNCLLDTKTHTLNEVNLCGKCLLAYIVDLETAVKELSDQLYSMSSVMRVAQEKLDALENQRIKTLISTATVDTQKDLEFANEIVELCKGQVKNVKSKENLK